MKRLLVLSAVIFLVSCGGDGNNTDAASEDSIGGIQLDTTNMINKTQADPMHLEKDSLPDSALHAQPMTP